MEHLLLKQIAKAKIVLCEGKESIKICKDLTSDSKKYMAYDFIVVLFL